MHVFPIVEHYIEHATFSKASTGRFLTNVGDGVKKGAGKLGEGVKKGAGKLGEGVKKGAGKLGEGVKKGAGKIGDKVTELSKKIDDKVAKVSKKMDDLVDTGAKKIDDVVDTGAKKIDDAPPPYSAIDGNGNKVPNVPKDPSEFSKFLSEYKGWIIGGTTLGAIATTAAVLSEKINKTDYTITSIKKDSTDPSKTVVTYTPEDMFTKRDSIMISSSNSDPNIDGEYSIQPIRGGSVKINKEISKQGNYGIMKCYTSVSNQTTQIINDITKPVTTTAAGITGGVITDVVGDIIPSTLQSFGLGGLGNVPVFSWIACVLCIIILSMLLMLVIVI